ncbi:MAG: glycosyltransferase family 2 protein [Anaerolineae bacterium]|nr:glycosyltransferase family 2 protein [Anaerolineae bacterium]
MRDLSIIIVSWNVADLLAACLDSILRSDVALDDADGERPNVEIIVVDSASSDKTVAMLRERYPQVRLSAQSENVGYTRGNNLGLGLAEGRNLFLLNPDTAIIGDALQQMIAYLDAHPDVGIVGPHTHNSDGTTQSSRRRFPTLATGFFESTWLQPFAPKAMLDRYYVRDSADDATVDVDWVQGSALLARREVYEQIGGLDEGYIMFSEELDWCKRAKLAGWRVVYLGSAHITHHGGKSTEQVVARKHIHFQESKLRYYRKYHGALAAHSLRLFLLFNYAWQIVLEGAKALLGHKPAMRRERIDAYWRVLRSGLRVH